MATPQPLKPKILITTSTFPRWKHDTEPAFVYELSRRLADCFDIHLLAPHYPGAAQYERRSGMVIHRYRYLPKFLERFETLTYAGGILPNLKSAPLKAMLIPLLIGAQIISMQRLLKAEQYQIIHTHWIIPQGICGATVKALSSTRFKLIITSHGGDLFSLNSWLFRKLKQWTIQQCDQLCVVSEAMREKALQIGASHDRITIAPMGVDLQNTFSPPPPGTERKGIILVGRLVEKKGVRYLIQAMLQVVHALPTTQLTIIGDGPQRAELERLAQDLRLGKHIIFCGAIKNSEVPSYLQSARIAVIPSIITSSGDQEGLGLTIIEALGCGCDVIASDLPAIRSAFKGISNLHLCPSKEPEALGSMITEALSKPEASSTNSSEHLKRFDWRSVANNYQHLYQRHMAGE